MKLSTGGAIVFALALSSCGGGGSGSTAAPLCVPGEQEACACPGGAPDGAQPCNEDGTGYDECECGGAGGGGATSTSSTTTPSTTTPSTTSQGGGGAGGNGGGGTTTTSGPLPMGYPCSDDCDCAPNNADDCGLCDKTAATEDAAGMCSKMCAIDGDCGAGFYCILLNGKSNCRPACETGNDCADPFVCYGAGTWCGPPL